MQTQLRLALLFVTPYDLKLTICESYDWKFYTCAHLQKSSETFINRRALNVTGTGPY